MSILDNEIHRITKLYKAVLSFYFSKDQRESLDIEDKPFNNLVECLYDLMKSDPFFSVDLLCYSINCELEKLPSLPNRITDDETRDLIKNIKLAFDINKQKHYILIPLQGSQLNNDCSFGNFSFVSIKNRDRKQLFQRIAEITNIEYNEVKQSLEHTEKSRSKNFLKSNILVVSVEDQTDNVKMSAFNIGQTTVSILMLLHDALEIEETGVFSFIRRSGHIYNDANKHVAILAHDHWRVGHGYGWDARLYCNIDLSFIFHKDAQVKFEKLYYLFTNKTQDELNAKFYNAFLIYSKAKFQLEKNYDKTIVLLLLVVSLESLIVEERNEKRLRLAAIVPRLISVQGKTRSELSKLLNKLYQQRNNFMHAGTTPTFSYEKNELELLSKIVAKTIMLVLSVDSKITPNDVNEKRLTTWNKYIDNKFNDILFGSDATNSANIS